MPGGARHRVGVRQDDYPDDDDDYYSQSPGSYQDNLSSSMERQYMFNRDRTGGGMASYFGRQESMASLPADEVEFELDMEVGTGEGGAAEGAAAAVERRQLLGRRDSQSFDTSRLTGEEVLKLNSVLLHVFDIMGPEAVSEHVVKTTIVRCGFDAEKALNELLTNPQHDIHDSPPKKPRVNKITETNKSFQLPAVTPEVPVVKAAVARNLVIGFDGPSVSAGSPTEPATLLTSPTKPPTISTTEPAALEHRKVETVRESGGKRSRSNSPLPSRMDVLSLEGTPTTSGRGTPEAATPANPTPLKQVVMRKEKLDVVAEYEKSRGDAKEMVNLVVVGHVDSGKSTLMGHLLFKLGNVSQKMMHKHEKESRKVGKQSFMYAWVLDETDEERERGITMDVGQNKFETAKKLVTLLDAPGHRDFIPNMISGAYQADVGVLVVNATTGEFEAGFEAGGQTREHALLVRSLGVSQLVVAVNKLDTVEWSEERFEAIQAKLRPFLTRQAGFRESDLTFLPCSGLTGENLTTSSSEEALAGWYRGPSLVEAIDALKPPERAINQPFRLSIADIYKGQAAGFSVAGRVEGGFVTMGDKVLVSPLNEVAVVKSVVVDQVAGWTGFAGDHVTVGLVGPDMAAITAGMVLSDPASPVTVTARFRARVVVFNIDVPITKGYPVVMHYGCVSEQATVKRLVSLLHKTTGEVVKARPRVLAGNCSAVVEVAVARPVPIELYRTNRELGRFMLRTGGHTIAAGMVTELL